MLSLEASTTARDLVTTHSEAFSGLLEHGMCEDCKAELKGVINA